MGDSTIILIQAFAAVATLFATVVLAWFTAILAKETRRLADAASQPQVVATLELNQWSMLHFDLVIENAGTGTAFDVETVFDPPLPIEGVRAEMKMKAPLQHISVLRPGQRMASYVAEYAALKDTSRTISVSWRRTPGGKRESISYSNTLDFQNVSQLGSASPLIQIADQMKKLREDWQRVARGSGRLHVETFDKDDRRERQDASRAAVRRQEANQEPRQGASDGGREED